MGEGGIINVGEKKHSERRRHSSVCKNAIRAEPGHRMIRVIIRAEGQVAPAAIFYHNAGIATCVCTLVSKLF